MLDYIKDKFTEYFLCLIFAVSVSINVFQGFWVSESQASNVIGLALLSAAILIVLYLSFYDKMTIIFLLLILAVSLIVFIIYSSYSNTFNNHFDISPYLFYIISISITVLAFFCSKSRASIIFLFLIDLVAFFILTILEYKNYPLGFIASLVCLCIMLWRKIYIHNTLKYHSAKSNVLIYTGILLILSSISMLLSAGIYYNIIQPKQLPVKKLALLAYPTVINFAERCGVASAQNIPDTSKTAQESKEFINTVLQSKNKNDSIAAQHKNQQTDNAADKAKSKPQEENLPDVPKQAGNNNKNKNNDKSNNPNKPRNNPNNDKTTKATPVTYFLELPVALIILISTSILIVLIIIIKKLLRKRWYRKLIKLDKNQQVIQLYAYFLKSLSILGYKRRKNDTPAEFAQRLGKSVDSGEFIKITDIFIEVNYGNLQITNDNYEFIITFYKSILKRCRDNLGLFKYILKYLLI